MNDDLDDLLKNYFTHRARVKAMEYGLTDAGAEESKRLAARLDFLDYCVNLLGEQDKEKRDVIEMVYYKRCSLRNYARIKHVARATANNRKEAALKDLRVLFNSRESH